MVVKISHATWKKKMYVASTVTISHTVFEGIGILFFQKKMFQRELTSVVQMIVFFSIFSELWEILRIV